MEVMSRIGNSGKGAMNCLMPYFLQLPPVLLLC